MGLITEYSIYVVFIITKHFKVFLKFFVLFFVILSFIYVGSIVFEEWTVYDGLRDAFGIFEGEELSKFILAYYMQFSFMLFNLLGV